jgi:mannose-1-phosphate guanylyltransferase
MNWTVFKRIHEEMLTIFSHKGNANQSYIDSISLQFGYHEEKKQQQMLARMHCWWEDKQRWKSIWRFLKNLKRELLCDTAYHSCAFSKGM